MPIFVGMATLLAAVALLVSAAVAAVLVWVNDTAERTSANPIVGKILLVICAVNSLKNLS